MLPNDGYSHIIDPNNFIENLIKLLNPGGLLFITCPNSNSLASKLFGKKWPIIIPGEHINIPSIEGLNICLNRNNNESGNYIKEILIKKLNIKYSLKYLIRYFTNPIGALMMTAKGNKK